MITNFILVHALVVAVTGMEEACLEELAVTGPCRGYFPSWSYNPNTQRCIEFVYGGCDGTGNNFPSEEECLAACVSELDDDIEDKNNNNPKDDQDADQGLDGACLEEYAVGGMCEAFIPRWSYNPSTQRCIEFVYGGCDGTGNNFESEEDCVAACLSEPEDKDDDKNKDNPKDDQNAGMEDVCLEGYAVAGNCMASFPKWSYNPDTQRCTEFIFGGCGGTGNNFESEDECVAACLSEPDDTDLDKNKDNSKDNQDEDKTDQVVDGACLEEFAVIGPCRAYTDRWSYNAETQGCEKFSYGGCDGNANRFVNEAECVDRCQVIKEGGDEGSDKDNNNGENEVEKPEEVVDAACLKEFAVVGPCRAYMDRWSYNPETQGCEKFSYGGCEGNANKFITEAECVERCQVIKGGGDDGSDKDKDNGENDVEKPDQVVDAACLEVFAVVGSCRAYTDRWSYHQETQGCEKFSYGGCDGNANNFVTEAECVDRCQVIKEGENDSTDKDKNNGDPACQEAFAVEGPCKAVRPRWSYNPDTRECEVFLYGGCEGNANNFRSVDECLATCVSKDADRTDEKCKEDKDDKTDDAGNEESPSIFIGIQQFFFGKRNEKYRIDETDKTDEKCKEDKEDKTDDDDDDDEQESPSIFIVIQQFFFGKRDEE